MRIGTPLLLLTVTSITWTFASASHAQGRPDFGDPASCAGPWAYRVMSPWPDFRPFPQILALDPFGSINQPGRIYYADGTSSANRGYSTADFEPDPSRDFGCFDYIRTNDSGLRETAASHGDITAMLWAGWGVVSARATLEDQSTLDIGTTTIPMYQGHWLFRTGAEILASVGAPPVSTCTLGATFSTTVTVDRMNLASNGITNPLFNTGDDVMIHRYGHPTAGQHDWTTTEHAEVLSTSGTTVTLTRSCAHARAWSYGSGQLRIAAHVHTWSNSDAWSVNLSDRGPVSGGCGGADPWACLSGWEYWAKYTYERWLQRMQPGASGFPSQAVAPHGIQIDGGRWLPMQGGHKDAHWEREPVDANNDNLPDWGYDKGYQRFGFGGTKAVAKLREYLCAAGQCDASLNADSTIPMNGARLAGFMNGIEIENPEANATQVHDYFSGAPSSLNSLRGAVERVRRWNEIPALSYLMTKANTEAYYCDTSNNVSPGGTNETGLNARFRVGLASDLIVGMPHSYTAENDSSGNVCKSIYEWDEYKAGYEESYRWLGYPSTRNAQAIRVLDDLGSANLVNASWRDHQATCRYGTSGLNTASLRTYSSGGFRMNVKRVCDVPHVDGIGATTTTVATTGQTSYTVDFEAWAKNHYAGTDCLDFRYETGKNVCDRLPRLLRVTLIFLKNNGDTQELTQDLQLDHDRRVHPYLSFIGASQTWTLTGLRISSGEQRGELRITDVNLRTGSSDRWVRYFDGGVSLLNLSDSPWTYQLDAGENCSGFRRIQGGQDTASTGTPIDDPAVPMDASCPTAIEAVVPARDALLLRKMP